MASSVNLLLLPFCCCLAIFSSALADVDVTMDEEMRRDFVVVRLADYTSIYNDLDPSKVRFMTYVILNKNSAPANLFDIGFTSGVITAAQKIDREKVCDQYEKCVLSFNVILQIAPESGLAFSNVISVKVTINDINDNAPRFPNREVTLEVSEGAKVGTELKISGAVDPDSRSEFTVQHYNSTPIVDTFSIRPTTNPDGSSTINLRLEKELDREKVSSYDFNIIAYDGGSNPKSDYLRVKVVVTDDNDNSPKFVKKDYTWTVKEDEKQGAVVGQVTAVDDDIGEYGRITYSFSQISESTIKGIFAINSSTGVITLLNDLISLQQISSPLLMYVDAKDGGDPPRSTQTLVSVDIMDSGNNAPIVRINTATTGDASTLTIPESARPDHFVAFVHIEDSDKGSNGDVTCALLSGNDFKLNPVPGKGYTLLLNREVDREDKDSYHVLISCEDGGIPPLEKAANLTVNISDINDNDPFFLRQIYTAEVSENRKEGQFVALVSARDNDIGVNADLKYSLSPNAEGYIQIQSHSGRVYTSGPLDRETNATLKFKVYATDDGTPRKTGTAEISITVKDENDNAPVFDSTKFTFFVSETTPNKTIIGNITAHDLDAGANSEFNFYFGGSSSGDMPLPITVLTNGSLVVSGLLDRETKPYYSFTVLVQDKGKMPKSNAASVQINILDVNDNDPVILFPTSNNHTIVISTYPENGMVLGRIIAYDVDEGSASSLRFSIYEGNEDNAFAMGPSNGELVMQSIERLQNPQEYLLFIKVEDSDEVPRNATTQLRIDVRFANRSEPIFKPEEEGGSRDQYVIIVGVIGGATFVLSVIIISAIIIILRSEKTRHRDNSGSFFKNKFFGGSSSNSSMPMAPQSKTVEQPVLTPKSQFQGSSTGSSDPNGLILSPGNLGGGVSGGVRRHDEGGKKVSFSLDLHDDFHDQSHDSSGSEKHMQLSPPLDQNSHWKKYAHPDDINSDTSGESGTCDSGRGTSDEDIKFDHSPSKGFPRNIPVEGPFSPREPLLNHHFPQKPSTVRAVPLMPGNHRIHASTPPIKTGHPGFLDNVFEGGSNNSINRGNNLVPSNKSRSSYHGQRGQQQLPYQQSASNASLRQPHHPPSHHSQQQQQHHPHRNNTTSFNDINNPDLLRPPSALSYAQQGSIVSMDDDASTTTSGSYVINPDDVRLDGLLGKDVIV